jgi:hypothetical protein
MYEPVLWDKSIYEQEDGSFILVLRADDQNDVIADLTLEEAQDTMDFLDPDGGEPLATPPRSVFNPTTKGT